MRCPPSMCPWSMSTMTLCCCRLETYRRAAGHRRGLRSHPVLPMSPSGGGGGRTVCTRWEEPRDCTWPRISPFQTGPDAREAEHVSAGSTRPAHAEPRPSVGGDWHADTQRLSQRMAPLGLLPANCRLLEELENRVHF
jgi:hypothetical protein